MPLSTIDNTGLSQSQILSAANMPTGSVVQVVNATQSTTTSTSSSSYQNTGLSASITPQFSTSKILVLVDIPGLAKFGSSSAQIDLQLIRGSTSIIQFEAGAGYNAVNQQNNIGATSLNYLDSPATTSPTTYAVQFRANNGQGTVVVANNDGGGSTGAMSMTLMEIR